MLKQNLSHDPTNGHARVDESFNLGRSLCPFVGNLDRHGRLARAAAARLRVD